MPIRRLRCLWLLALLVGCQRVGGEAPEVIPAAEAAATAEEPPPDPKAGIPVSWEGWTFHWSVRRRDGLVLTNVAFRGRSVLKYAGLAEIFVPYNPGEPRPEDFQDGMGNTLVELIPGQDCFPGTVCQAFNDRGKQEGKRVVMMHEEPAGLVYLGRFGRAYGKMLVLCAMSRLQGYTYITCRRFRDDGTLITQVVLTGEFEQTTPV